MSEQRAPADPSASSGRRWYRRPPIAAEARPGSLAALAATFFAGPTLRSRSPGTRKTYRDGWERLREFLRELGIDVDTAEPSALPANLLADFYDWQMPTGDNIDPRVKAAKDRTARTATYAMSSFLRFLVEAGHLDSLERYRASLRTHLRRGEYKRRSVDSRIDEFVDWVASRPLPEDVPARLDLLRAKALVLTLYSTGMRRAEVTGLRVVDVLGAAGDGSAEITGKGDRTRTVFFSRPALDALLTSIQERERHGIRSPYAFCSLGNHQRRDRQLTPATVWQIVHQQAQDAEPGGPRFLHLPDQLTTHQTRHHFGQTLMDAGNDISVIQELLGHTSPDTTARVYAQPKKDALRRAVAHAPGHSDQH